MAVIDTQRESLVIDVSNEKISLREENRRTGRYIAAGAAIFLSLLGVYQAIIRGTPEYAALFAPALIMFIYILWILYASKQYKHKTMKDFERVMATTEVTPDWNVTDDTILEDEVPSTEKTLPVRNSSYIFNRSYSIA